MNAVALSSSEGETPALQSMAWTNREATHGSVVPGRLLVLGGGAVGVELAQAYRRLGSEVALVEGASRLLGREEPFAGDEVRLAFEADGIEVLLDARAAGVSRTNGTIMLRLEDGGSSRATSCSSAWDDGRARRISASRRSGSSRDVSSRWTTACERSAWRVDGCTRSVTSTGARRSRTWGSTTHDWPATRSSARTCGRSRITARSPGSPSRIPRSRRSVSPRSRLASRGSRFAVSPTGRATSQARTPAATASAARASSSSTKPRRVVVGATFTGPDVQELLHSATIAIVAEVPLETLWHAVPSFPTVSEVWLRLLETYGL